YSVGKVNGFAIQITSAPLICGLRRLSDHLGCGRAMKMQSQGYRPAETAGQVDQVIGGEATGVVAQASHRMQINDGSFGQDSSIFSTQRDLQSGSRAEDSGGVLPGADAF